MKYLRNRHTKNDFQRNLNATIVKLTLPESGPLQVYNQRVMKKLQSILLLLPKAKNNGSKAS